MKSKMKIEVRNEDCPPPGCLSQRLKIWTRPCCCDRCCCPFTPGGAFTPGGVGILRKLLFSRSRGVNAFVGVDNGLPTALPHASPRLKIPMAPHWCCRVTPRAGYPGGRYPGKALDLEKLGVKVQGVILVKSKMKIKVRNEDWSPPGCLSLRLKIGTRPCSGDRCCCPIYPLWGRYSGKTLILEIPGGKCVRMRG